MAKILVIEDNHLLRENISDILSMEDYEVYAAENGQVGVEKALEHLPDLIVSDINMPIMDGYEVLEALRKEEQAKTIPFVFLTVKSTMGELRTGMNLGADDYLTKPFEMHELLLTVQTRLNKKDEIIARETLKYDQLKNAVGLPITSVISDPLKNIEKLAELVQGQLSNLNNHEIEEITSLIATDASKLRKDIDKVLLFYRIEALKAKPDSIEEMHGMITINSDQLISKLIMNTCQDFKRQKDVYLNLEAADLCIPTDFLEYITKELVTNACKFSTRGTALKVTGTKKIGQYAITFQDHGLGFHSKTAFEEVGPYIKLNDDQSKNDGLGLGLYNVKTLAELFGVEVTLQSEPGMGSAITLSFKLAG